MLARMRFTERFALLKSYPLPSFYLEQNAEARVEGSRITLAFMARVLWTWKKREDPEGAMCREWGWGSASVHLPTDHTNFPPSAEAEINR